MLVREGFRYQIIFNSKIYVADFGNFKRGLFEHEIDTKRVNSGFRVCFFNNCIEKNQNKTHFEEGMCMHFILSGPHTSLHICNHIHYKKLQYNFPKMRVGGQRPFRFFPKIHPDPSLTPNEKFNPFKGWLFSIH